MKRAFLLLWLILILAGQSYGQLPYFQHYSLLKRNESVHINVVFQDRSGFIWHGTDKGLFRFDGIRLEHFNVTKDSLPDNHVTAIAQDSLGRIWVGHRNGKIAFIDNRKVVGFEPEEGSSSQEISDLIFDRHGNLWYSTLNDGLYYYKQGRLYRVDEDEGLPDLFVYDIVEDAMGNVWVGTDGGVAICTLNNQKLTIKVLDYDHGLPDNIIKKLIIRDNKVWMGTEDAGVIVFDPSSGLTTSALPVEWKFGSLTDFVLAGDEVWIASAQSGLVVYDLKSRSSKTYPAGTENDFMSINTLLSDVEGNIWIGTKTGLIRTLSDHIEYIATFDPYKSTNVLALTIDKNDNVWYSTSEGLFKRSIDEMGIARIERPFYNTPFREYTTVSLYTDSTGDIWAGFYGEGTVRMNPSTGETRHFRKELRNGNVLSITGSGSDIWLATLGGSTRIKDRGNELEITNYSREQGLASDYIYQVFIDSRKRVWFGTDGKGAVMLDESGFHQYDKGLNSKVVYGFAEDSNGQLWINVQGEGIYRFSGDGFIPMDSRVTLRDRNINILGSDNTGNLIVMHDLGIDIYNIAKNRIRYLGDEVGMRDKRPNLNALSRDEHGHMYAGTDKGIVRYSNLTNDILNSPLPLIENLKVLDRTFSLSNDLSFKYYQNSVIIHYIGFWYQNPGDLNFQYQLENYDRDWISSRDRSATYSSLPPGTYTFRLRVADVEDFREAKEVSFTFTIRPPFWRTVWFYLLAALLVLLAVASFIQFRERKLIEDKKILEEKVKARTLEIQQQSEEIQAQNEEIQSQAEEIQGINDNLELLVQARTAELERKNKAAEESAFIIAHELRAPVASILGLINLISKCELNDESRNIVNHMEDSADKLNKVVRKITKAIERGDRKS